MAGWIMFAAGVLVLAVTLFDFLKTTIGMAGIGPISGRIAGGLWWSARKVLPGLHRRFGMSFEDVVGPGILCGIAGGWIVLSWAGYALMFAPDAAVTMPHGDDVSVAETVAFAGASISTVGARLSQAGDGRWDILSAVAAVNGMVMLTLSVSFIMTVWQTTRQARSLAMRVAALEGVADRLSDEALADELESLGTDFGGLVVAIRATPVVGFFATERNEMSLSLAVLSLCRLVRRVGDRPKSPKMQVLRMALDALATVGTEPGEEVGDGLDGACRWAESRRLIA